MTKRPSSNALNKVVKRKVRSTKTEQQLINFKYLGAEPTWTTNQTIDQTTYIKTMTWYNYMCTKDDARKYLETHFKNTGRTNDIATLKRVPDSRIVDQTAWIARIMSRGVKLDNKTIEFLNNKIKEQLTYAENKISTEDKIQKPKVSIQERVNDKVSDFIGQFEEAIDTEGWTLSMYEWLQKHHIQPMLASKIVAFYKPIAEEASLLIKNNVAPDLAEGYNHYTKKQLKERSTFYSSIISDCDRFSSNTKKIRMPRKPKTLTTEKQLKNFKYLKESKEFRVASIQPEKLLGSQELWTFNTKYKILTIFYALDRAGLGVSGTSIKNYDEEKSITKRISKKTEEHIQTILTGGKRIIAKLINNLKDAPVLQHRINENTILLKVIKE